MVVKQSTRQAADCTGDAEPPEDRGIHMATQRPQPDDGTDRMRGGHRRHGEPRVDDEPERRRLMDAA
jgi:hypothetical protein